MCSTLKVEPANPNKKSLPYELKFIFRKRYGGTISRQKMDSSDLVYVQALVDAEIQGAQFLKELIEKYDEVILDEEF